MSRLHLWNSPAVTIRCRVYSNCCCSCSFEPEIIKMYSNKILNFEESTTILNASKKKSLETYWIHHTHTHTHTHTYIYIYIHIYIYVCVCVCFLNEKLTCTFFLMSQSSFVYTQWNGFNYCYSTPIILFNINHLFAHS